MLSEEYDYDETVEHLQRVFGIAEICPMVQVEDEGFDKLCGTLVEYMDDVYADKHITFKVSARRARKNYPLDSYDDQFRGGRRPAGCVPGYEGGCA